MSRIPTYKVNRPHKYSPDELFEIYKKTIFNWIDSHYMEPHSFVELQNEVSNAYHYVANNGSSLKSGFRAEHGASKGLGLMDGSLMMRNFIVYYLEKVKPLIATYGAGYFGIPPEMVGETVNPVAANEVAKALAAATRKGGRRRRGSQKMSKARFSAKRSTKRRHRKN